MLSDGDAVAQVMGARTERARPSILDPCGSRCRRSPDEERLVVGLEREQQPSVVTQRERADGVGENLRVLLPEVAVSENRTAASTPWRRTGCNVASAASSGVIASSISVRPWRSSRYSGSERPAWRMNQTGTRSLDGLAAESPDQQRPHAAYAAPW
jgi:hypothetical protein